MCILSQFKIKIKKIEKKEGSGWQEIQIYCINQRRMSSFGKDWSTEQDNLEESRPEASWSLQANYIPSNNCIMV